MAYKFGAGKNAYELPVDDSSGESGYNDNDYPRGFAGGSQNDYDQYDDNNGPPRQAADYNYDYGGDGNGDVMYQDDQQEAEPQDIYKAAYEGINQNNQYANPDEAADYDPYAGIDIDYSKIAKVEKKPGTDKESGEDSQADDRDKSSSRKEGEESERSGSQKPGASEKSSAHDKEADSKSDIDRGRVEEEHDESNEAAGSGEKIMNFQDLKRMYEKKEDQDQDQDRKGDAISLANQQQPDEEVPPKLTKRSAEVLPKYEPPEDKGQDSDSNALPEDNAPIPADQQLEDKVPTVDNEKSHTEKADYEHKEPVPVKSGAEPKADAVNAGDTCSYEDDFEQSSIPASSRDRDAGVPKEPVQEQPPEENNDSSEEPKKPMSWADFKKTEAANVPPVTVATNQEPEYQHITDNKTKADNPPVELPPTQNRQTGFVPTIEQPKQVVEIIKKIRVDDKEVQTEIGPVQFADKSTRECLLEATILDEKKRTKNLQVENEKLEETLKRSHEDRRKGELELLDARRKVEEFSETIKRLMNENKESMHEKNLLKIEKEDLARKVQEQAQMVQDSDKDKQLIKEECDKKVKFAEDRAQQQVQKFESRALEEQRHNFELEKSILSKQMADKDEEVFYYKEKCNKLETENTTLRSTNKVKLDAETKIRELQQENYVLQAKLNDAPANGKKESSSDNGIKDDSILRKEAEAREILIAGYQKENENMTDEIRKLKLKLKDMEALMYKENVRMREEQSKIVRNNEKVVVVENSADVGIDVWNRLGKSNMVSVGELKGIKLQMEMLAMDKKRLEDQLSAGAKQAKAEIGLVINQKQELEARLGMSYEDMQKEKAEKARLEREWVESEKKHREEIEGLRGRIKWLVDNQELVEKNVQIIREKDEEIGKLKSRLKEIADNRGLRISSDMKKSEELKSRTVKSVHFAEGEGEERLKKQVVGLQKELKDTESRYEARIRSLQQQYEKVKAQYGAKSGDISFDDRIKALEQEKEEMKEYYMKRLREYEQKENNSGLSNRSAISVSGNVESADNFARSLRQFLDSPDGFLTAELLLHVLRVRNGIESGNMEEVAKTMEEITQTLAGVSEGSKGMQAEMASKLIDSIMGLGKIVLPEIQDRDAALKAIGEIAGTLFKEVERRTGGSKEKPKTRYSASSSVEDEKKCVVDFSDDSAVEANETDLSTTVAIELKKWVEATNDLTIEFIQSKCDPSHCGRVSPQDLLSAIKAAKCEVSAENLGLWIRRLDFTADGKINYVILIDNLKTKDHEWWSKHVSSHRVGDKGGLVPKPLIPFIQSSISAKLKQHYKAEPVDSVLKNLSEIPDTHFTKSHLRKVFLDLKLPLNREDVAVLFSLLSSDGAVVVKKTLEEFLAAPTKIPELPKVKEAWGSTHPSSSTSLDPQTLYRRVARFVAEKKIDIESGYKPVGNGNMTYEEFCTAANEHSLPLNDAELREIFCSLAYSADGTADFNDFIQNVLAYQEKPHTSDGKWEAKARTLHARQKELTGVCKKLEQEKRDLEYKIQTICRDPKQKQILDLQRKIAALESVVRERDAYIRKTLGSTGNLEMSIMRKNVEMEKAELLQVIANKNKEILMFKSELDSVMDAMQKLKKNKKR